jgi:ferritin-like protein
MAHEGLHEDISLLGEDVIDYHRVIQSTIEELEAVDWYNQRAAATNNADAKALMEHNRDEEIEHACMGLEWLRRNSPTWDAMLREFLFREGPLTSHGEDEGEEDSAPAKKSSSLKIGKNA